MQFEYKLVQSNIKPAELDVSSSGEIVYVRRNISEVISEDNEGREIVFWQYQEAQLTANEYAVYQKQSLISELNGEDNSQEYEDFKNKLNSPVKYKNGHCYKAKWISLYAGIIKDLKDALEIYKLVNEDISGFMQLKTNIYDATGLPENAVEMSIKEIIDLYMFLYKYKEQCFDELKQAKAGA